MSNKVKQTVTLLMALAMLSSVCCTAAPYASAVQGETKTSASVRRDATAYDDVPQNYWAYQDIQALTAGGLLKGNGSGKFFPEEEMTLSQYVTLIARLRGEESGANYENWAGQTIADAKANKWLDDNVETDAYAYGDKPISRCIAIITLVRAMNPPSKNLGYTKDSIPDLSDIGSDCWDDVLAAYNAGITDGVDSQHTFNPTAGITRAEVAAILNRAGYTTAKAPVLPDGKAPSSKEVFAYLKSVSPFTEEISEDKSLSDYGNAYLEYTKNPYAGAVFVGYCADGDKRICIGLSEAMDPPVSRSDFDKKGMYKKNSGYSYASRQLVKKILQYAYPTGSAQAYQMLQQVFAQKRYDTDGYANGVLWIDGRACVIMLQEATHGYSDVAIAIGEVGDRAMYTSLMNLPYTMGQWHMDDKDPVNWTTAFELNKW